jgi:Arc/MetJ family transcription regulator
MANVRRTSINLDFDLVERAKTALGTSGTTETVHRALEEAWRRDALGRLAEWRFEGVDHEQLRKEAWEHEGYP